MPSENIIQLCIYSVKCVVESKDKNRSLMEFKVVDKSYYEGDVKERILKALDKNYKKIIVLNISRLMTKRAGGPEPDIYGLEPVTKNQRKRKP